MKSFTGQVAIRVTRILLRRDWRTENEVKWRCYRVLGLGIGRGECAHHSHRSLGFRVL